MKQTMKILPLLLAVPLLFGGCSKQSVLADVSSTINDSNNSSKNNGSNTEATIASSYFSDRDFEVGYDEDESAFITLKGDSADCSSNAVQITGSTVTITEEGTYVLSGELDDGMIVVNTDKTDKVQLVLNGADIHSKTSAPIYVVQSDKVFLTTAADTVNTLSNGGTFDAIDESDIDAVIFSKEDLTLNGSGTLVVTSPAGHGIVSKDSLRLTSGRYEISCASHALAGKDDVCIANADMTIVAGKDGIHAENTEDDSLGFVYIQSGSFDISAEGDGISASSYMQIADGTFTVISGGGSSNAAAHSSQSFGRFMGSKGGKAGSPASGTTSSANAETGDDGTSMKGIKSASNLIIDGGSFTINSADDAVHSNASITVNGGTFDIAAGDDGFHADETLTVLDGTVLISESYEGLEALHIIISGGEITLTASDDGLNAAGGMDASGMGGRDAMGGRGTMGGGMSSSSGGTITIAGGTIHITACGDGIDANGSVEMTDGYVVVCGPNQGDTSTLDYDTQAVISGGTFIGTGASGMAQTFSDSEQGVIALKVGSQTEGTSVLLSDSKGNTVISHTPQLAFSVVILSSPEIVKGETYTVTVGSSSGEFTAQ